jgi:hypothetical protein
MHFLEEFLQCKSSYLVARDDRQIYGILPYLAADGPLGRVINSLPYYGSNGGIIASSQKAKMLLVDAYNALVTDSCVASSTYIPNVFYADMPFVGVAHDYVDERIGQVTFLANDGDDSLFDRIDSSSRRNIRRAIKSDVQVSIDNDALDFLMKVHKDNMGVIGGREKTPEFFHKIPLYFEKNSDYRVYTASLNGQMIAALLVFYFGNTVEYFTPVTVTEFRSMQPMSLILYTAMMDATELNFKYWNWGATWPSQHGVYKFKGKWDAQDYLYKYYVKLNNKKILGMKPADILSLYPNFYVIPFDCLTQNAASP